MGKALADGREEVPELDSWILKSAQGFACLVVTFVFWDFR